MPVETLRTTANLTEVFVPGSRREPWWTVDPETGQPTQVLPALEVEQARARATEADVKVGVLCEAGARLRPLARRALTEGGESGDQARRDLHEAIAWIARGGVEPTPECLDA
jgi:hypothetical protein